MHGVYKREKSIKPNATNGVYRFLSCSRSNGDSEPSVLLSEAYKTPIVLTTISLATNPVKRLIIVTYNSEETILENGMEINVVPAWKWLLES